jgi:hypothetical protein
MKKIHIFHTLVIGFIVLCFLVSFKLDNLIELLIFTFALMFSVAYLFALAITSNKK